MGGNAMTSPKPAMGAAELVTLLHQRKRGWQSHSLALSRTEAIALVEQRDTALNAELQAHCDRLAELEAAAMECLRVWEMDDITPEEFEQRLLNYDTGLPVDHPSKETARIQARFMRAVYALRAGKEGSHDEG